MNEKNLKKLEQIKTKFNERNVIFTELPNGHLQIDHLNFWATSEKFYDPTTGYKGKGINAFLQYAADKGVIK